MPQKRIFKSAEAVENQAKAQSHTRQQPRDKDATRQRILDAAEEVFSQKGYYGAMVDDIADAAQTSKGGFYFHFPNKQSIFLALVQSLTPRIIQSVNHSIESEQDPVARLDAALHVTVDLFARHRRLSKILLIEALSLGHEFDKAIFDARDQFIHLIQQRLQEAVEAKAIPQQDTAIAAAVWFGAINELVTRWLVTGSPEKLETVIPALRALLLNSIGAPQVFQSNSVESSAEL